MRGLVCAVFCILMLFGNLLAELHPLGCIFEDPREVSWIHEAHIEVTTTRTQVDLSPFMPPVGNQLTQGSCIAWAVGYYHKTYLEWFEHRWNVNLQLHQFSPAFMYNQINGGVDQGARFSDAMKCLCDHGCANLIDSPYNPNDSTTWPSEQAYINAMFYRSDSAHTVFCGNDAGVNAVRQLLSDSVVVNIGIKCWSTNFDDIEDYDTMFCVADTGTGYIRGGHAVTIVGYDDSKVTHDGTGAFRLVNSWGTGWGNSGYFWMSYEAVKHPRLSGGFAYYTTDKTGYSPNVRVRYRLNHPTRGRIETRVGIGSSTRADWTKDFFDWNKPTIADWPFPAHNVVLDISDGSSFLDSTAINNVFLRCRDTLTDAQSGSIVFFSCDHLGWGANSVSTETPQSIPDDGTQAIVNLSLEYLEPDISVTPDTLEYIYSTAKTKEYSGENNPRLPDGSYYSTLGELDAPRAKSIDTIYYDDGYYRYYYDDANWLWAVRFTPTSACSIIGALTEVWNPNDITTPCTLWVWDDNGGVPGTVIGGPVVFGTTDLTWQYTPLSVEVTRSDFHIGYWVPGGDAGTEGPFALIDSGAVGRSQFSSGSGWTPLTQGDLFIRAVVSFGSIIDTVGAMYVHNDGDTTLNVTDITGSETWITNITPTTFSVNPGDSQAVDVTVTKDFLPNGTHYASLLIDSDDPDEDPYTEPIKLVISGIPVESDIVVKPDTLDFFYVKESLKKSDEPTPYNNIVPHALEGNGGNIYKLDEEPLVQSPLPYISSFLEAHNTSQDISPTSGCDFMPTPHKINCGNTLDVTDYREDAKRIYKDKEPKAASIDTLHYDGPYDNNAIGLTAGGTYEAAIRLTPTELAGYDGWKIISVLFYHHETATHSCAAKIYGNNTPTLPGALKSQKTYSASGSGWHRIDLTSPVVINSSNDTWVSVEVTHAAGEYPIGVDAGPAVPGKGRWIFYNSTWTETGYDDNWNVRAIVSSGDTVNMMFVKNTGILDLNVTNITGSQAWITDISPTNFTVSPGDSQYVTVTVTRDALSDGDHYAYLSIYSDDPDENPYTEPIKFVIRTKPDITASPDTLEFTYSPKETKDPSLLQPSKDGIITQNYETYEPPSLFKSTIDTIFYDDGSYAYYYTNENWLWAVRFTSTSACSVIGALTAVYNPHSITTPCTLWVWDDNGGVPGNVIGGPVVFGTPSLTWQHTPLSVEVARSDFHIGYWVPGGDVDTDPSAGPCPLIDDGAVGRSNTNSGGGWTSITLGDLFIRAIVSYGAPASDTVQNMWVYNIGNADLNVTNITGSQSWITDITPTIFSISPGDSQGVAVTVTKDALGNGTHYAYLSIYSDDPDESPYTEPVKFVVGGGMEITEDNQLPRNFFLSQNNPNPFSKATIMKYGITKDCTVYLSVYNLSGQKVASLTNGHKKAGYYDIGWDGMDDRDVDLPPGIYFCTLQTDECRITRKMILIR